MLKKSMTIFATFATFENYLAAKMSFSIYYPLYLSVQKIWARFLFSTFIFFKANTFLLLNTIIFFFRNIICNEQ